MPIHRGRDSQGNYYQWGNHGHKYHYPAGNGIARQNAKRKAVKQAQAAYSHGYRE